MHLAAISTEVDEEIWAGYYQCPNCGRPESFHLCKAKRKMYFLGIQIIAKTVDRYIVCDNCDSCSKLSKEDYDRIYNPQKQKLNNMQFPDEVVLADYSPKMLKLGKRIAKFILSLVVGLFYIIMGIQITSGLEANFDFMFIILDCAFFALGAAIIFFGTKNLIKTIKKKKIYDSVSRKISE